MYASPKSRWLLGAAVVGVFAAVLAQSPASAQDYDSGYGYRNSSENIEVIAPPRRPHEQSVIGARTGHFRVSEEVPYGDLDLRTREGAHILKARIQMAARRECDRLNDSAYPDFQYPHTTDSPPCFSTAVRRAMYEADAAITEARETASRE